MYAVTVTVICAGLTALLIGGFVVKAASNEIHQHFNQIERSF